MKQSAIVRLGGIRAVAIFLLNIAGALISILLLPAALLYPIASGHRPVVEVRDEAGIYHEQALRHGLEEQVYDREVRIAVLSVPGSGISNIDEEIVKYASDGTQGSSWFKDSDVDSPVNGTILFVVARVSLGTLLRGEGPATVSRQTDGHRERGGKPLRSERLG